MSGSMVEVMSSSTTPRMGRRSMALSDIDPKYVSQSGIWEASEVETSRGSIRIQHLTAVSAAAASSRASSASMGSACGGGISGAISSASSGITAGGGGASNNPRFPKLEECAHFHYDCVELPQLKIRIRDDPSKPISVTGDENQDKCAFSIEVVAGGQSWAIRRTHNNIQMLDSQLHRCVWDRTFSLLEKVHQESAVDQLQQQHNGCWEFVTNYLARLNQLPTSAITCGTVLSWLELDNRGRHIVSSDESAINTPAVAAACAVKKYVAQAADEISFEVGEMISVIDMPPPEDSNWWRGKRGFQVGFFPRDYVQVIGDKIPAGLPIVPSVRKLQRLSVSSSSTTSSVPDKPVLRKHGKLIAFFRSFILSRPSRRRLKQSGILRERVFSCDLAEHLLNTGNDIPTVLRSCAEFIEKHGIVDGVYRLSGITSNIQKLRNAFDEDKIPNLESDMAIKQDIHAVSSLLKMFFREFPNPLCTYQLYEKFVSAAKESDQERLFKMREVVHELPPPHYRTLEYLMKHLSRVAERSSDTGMTHKNLAIVWAPNLIRCKELETGGVNALKGIGVQAVVTEYLIRHADLIFNDKLPTNFPTTTTVLTQKSSGSSRPKSLAISSPIKLMSLEEAQDKARDDRKFIDVGGGPSSLPPKYHTVIDLPSSRRAGLKNKRSPMGWKHFFSRNRSFNASKPQRKAFTPGDITVITKNMPQPGPQGMQTNWTGRLRPLRPVKSVESLVSPPLYNTATGSGAGHGNESSAILRDQHSESVIMEEMESSLSRSSPATPVAADVVFHPLPANSIDARCLQSKTHNRSISHDSYFEFGEFRNSNNVYIDDTLEEETMSQSSKLSLDLSGSEIGSNVTSPVKAAGCSLRSKSEERERSRKEPFKSPITPPPSAASTMHPSDSYQNALSDENIVVTKRNSTATSPIFFKSQARPSKWRDSEVQTSQLKLSDVGVSTEEESGIYGTGTRKGVDSSTSMDEELGRYELDKNSSFDESSEMSTPEKEQFLSSISTNIIYSPLVNEISSMSSAEHINLLHSTSSISSTSTQKLSVNSNRSSKSVDDAFTTTSSANVCLFVCPLYEAGVTNEDLIGRPAAHQDVFNQCQAANDDVVVLVETTNSVAQEASSSEIADYSDLNSNTSKDLSHIAVNNNPVENKYENDSIGKIDELTTASNILTTAKTIPPQSKEICHIYENERIYQNEPVAPSRKKLAVSSETLSSKSSSSSVLHPNNVTTTSTQLESFSQQNQISEEKSGAVLEFEQIIMIKPKAKEPLPLTCIDVNAAYTDCIGEEHYENISESHYEGNIYEDIDSESDKQQREGKYRGTNSCRYEAVSSPPIKPSDTFAVSLSSTGCGTGGRLKDNSAPSSFYPPQDLPAEENWDDHDDGDYESVRFQKVDDKLIPHHYSEIEEKTASTTALDDNNDDSKSGSTPSHSRTDEMITYLEVQTPSFKLRTDSLEDNNKSEEQSSYESVGLKNSETIDDVNSPISVDEVIHFIDSPLVVENPVYSLEMEGINPEDIETMHKTQMQCSRGAGGAEEDDGDFDVSINESVSLSLSVEEDKSNTTHGKPMQLKSQNLKLLGRCNSAPLTETKVDFVITDVYRQSDDRPSSTLVNDQQKHQQNKNNNDNLTLFKLPLNKRLSEPSLLQFNVNSNSLTIKTDENNATAWKLTDAKRLANRKSSVKELLSKFESRDSTPSPTNTSFSNHFNTLPHVHNNNKDTQGSLVPGLPKPVSQNSLKVSVRGSGSAVIGRNKNTDALGGFGGTGTGSGRFQHHRFSMGDILLGQSMSESDDLNSVCSHSPSPKNSMIRSDTFPELRSANSRVPTASKENLDLSASLDRNSQSQGNLLNDNNDASPLVPEKGAQNALRIAMSAVDMNDPNTRERIEKYKEERRSFLRQKITSEINSECTQKPCIATTTTEEGEKEESPSTLSPADVESCNSEVLSNRLNANDNDSYISTISNTTRSNSSSTQVTTFTSNNKSPSDSPRKRAFSEDIPQAFSNSYFTKTKSIKTEPEFTKYSEESSTTKSTITQGIKIHEKIALWTLQKKEISKSTLSCAEISSNKSSTDSSHKPFVKPILRREVTTSSISSVELSKCKLNVARVENSSNGGKKIKDMAAFFEAKKF